MCLSGCIPNSQLNDHNGNKHNGNKHKGEPCIALSSAVEYCLLPAAQAPTLSLTQHVQIDWNEQQFTLLSVLEVDQTAMTLVMLNPVGQTLFSVRQDGQGVTSHAAMKLPTGFDPAVLLGLIQLANWPEQQLRDHLHLAVTACLQLKTTPASRTLWCDEQPVLSVVYPDGKTHTSYQLKLFSAPFQLRATEVMAE